MPETEWLNMTEILEGKMWNKGIVRAMLLLKPGEGNPALSLYSFWQFCKLWLSLSCGNMTLISVSVFTRHSPYPCVSLCVQTSPLYEDTYYMLEAQSCPTLCKPIDCSPLGFFVHGILQARILEWMAIPCSRESSWPRDRTQISYVAGIFFTVWATKEAPY